MVSSITFQRHAALKDELQELVISSKTGDVEEFIIRSYLENRVKELEKELSYIER